MLSLTWGSSRGRSRVQLRCRRRDWGGRLGERAKRVAKGIPVLSYPLNGSSHHSQADHSPPSGSSLQENNSPTHKRDSAPALWYLSLIAGCRVNKLITEGGYHRCRSLAKGSGKSGLETFQERLWTEARGENQKSGHQGTSAESSPILQQPSPSGRPFPSEHQ